MFELFFILIFFLQNTYYSYVQTSTPHLFHAMSSLHALTIKEHKIKDRNWNRLPWDRSGEVELESCVVGGIGESMKRGKKEYGVRNEGGVHLYL